MPQIARTTKLHHPEEHDSAVNVAVMPEDLRQIGGLAADDPQGHVGDRGRRSHVLRLTDAR